MSQLEDMSEKAVLKKGAKQLKEESEAEHDVSFCFVSFYFILHFIFIFMFCFFFILHRTTNKIGPAGMSTTGRSGDELHNHMNAEITRLQRLVFFCLGWAQFQNFKFLPCLSNVS